jgi:hypothetical protein
MEALVDGLPVTEGTRICACVLLIEMKLHYFVIFEHSGHAILAA